MSKEPKPGDVVEVYNKSGTKTKEYIIGKIDFSDKKDKYYIQYFGIDNQVIAGMNVDVENVKKIREGIWKLTTNEGGGKRSGKNHSGKRSRKSRKNKRKGGRKSRKH